MCHAQSNDRLPKRRFSLFAGMLLAATAFTIAMYDVARAADEKDESSLEITVGRPFTLFKQIVTEEMTGKQWWEEHGTWGFWCFPTLVSCPDGSLLIRFSSGADAFMATQKAPSVYRSDNKGRTWSPEPMGKIASLSPRVRESFIRFNGKEPLYGIDPSGYCNLSDGTAVAFFYHAVKDIAPGAGPEQFVTSMWRSADGGKIWEGPSDVNVVVPGNAQDSLGRGPAFWNRSVELKNGNLVATAHTLFEGDKRLRVIALESADKGKNWRYLATVAHDPEANVEGFTEPNICKLANDELICLARADTNPMYQSYSSDGGKTWSKSVMSGVVGVAPDMHVLSNGVLACSYGRPGINIMFSAEGDGRRWTNHTEVFNGDSTSYTSFEEVSPGRILFVFDSLKFKDDPSQEPANCIRGVFIDVKRAAK